MGACLVNLTGFSTRAIDATQEALVVASLAGCYPCRISASPSQTSESRIQSDIMHELAHVLLGHKMEEINPSLGFPLRKYDQSQEDEAEWLGGCLQLPSKHSMNHVLIGI